MRWASVLSDSKTLDQAIEQTVVALRRELRGEKPDLLLVFASSEFLEGYDTIAPRLQAEFNPRILMGCSGGGVVGDGREIEHQAALTVTAAILPDVTLTPFRVADGSLPDLDASPRQWQSLAGVSPTEQPHFILLADPFSIRIENLLMGMDYAYPKSVKVGGLASGAKHPGENALFFNSVCYRSGAIGLALSGNIALDALVAQGCRPIGQSYRVTKCDRNILLQLDGQRPLNILRDLYTTLDVRDQALLQSSLFLGLAMDPMKSHFTQGDFLIRNIVGLDTEKGIMAIGAMLREGQLVQFHLRDAQTSSDDLDQVLENYRARPSHEQVAGALLFSCLGRGAHLYRQPSFDTQTFHKKLGKIPVAGFFCNGEIGPVSGTTYLHGYTSCFALFRPLYVTSSPAFVSKPSTARPLPPTP